MNPHAHGLLFKSSMFRPPQAVFHKASCTLQNSLGIHLFGILCDQSDQYLARARQPALSGKLYKALFSLTNLYRTR